MAAVAAAGCAESGRGKPAARLRVMMNGGIYEEHAGRLVIDPFEHDTGAMIIGRG